MKDWKQHACFYCVVVVRRGGSRRRGDSRLQCWRSPVWFSSLCGGRPFVHALSIRQPTGCYAVILIHPFLLHVVDIPLCSTFLSISAGKYPFKIFSYTRSCIKIFCTKIFCMEYFRHENIPNYSMHKSWVLKIWSKNTWHNSLCIVFHTAP